MSRILKAPVDPPLSTLELARLLEMKPSSTLAQCIIRVRAQRSHGREA